MAWAIPYWLTGIRLSAVAEDKRPVIEAFQREAVDVLYRHFSRPLSLPAASQAVVLADPLAHQVATLASQIEELASTMNLMQEHLAALRGQTSESLAMRQALTARQSATELTVTEIDERTQRLTPAHARAIQDMVSQLVQDTEKHAQPITYAIAYGRLKTVFRAGSYSEIPDHRFNDATEFLKRMYANVTSGALVEQVTLFKDDSP